MQKCPAENIHIAQLRQCASNYIITHKISEKIDFTLSSGKWIRQPVNIDHDYFCAAPLTASVISKSHRLGSLCTSNF